MNRVKINLLFATLLIWGIGWLGKPSTDDLPLLSWTLTMLLFYAVCLGIANILIRIGISGAKEECKKVKYHNPES